METKKLVVLILKIDEHKNRIAKERDAIRVIADELSDLLESLDTGVEALECGSIEIKNGIDSISELV